NHPSDRWTQDDFYEWSGLFARVKYKVLENKREIATDEHEWNGEQIVYWSRDGAVKNPRTGQDVRPRFLGEPDGLPLAVSGPGTGRHRTGGEPLAALAVWLTRPGNTWFARVQVNRIWFQLMGRGLVDPPDDFRATNPASHPELLDALAAEFVRGAF